MNPSRLFIVRPVATVLTMIAILLAGALAYRQLPVSALPQVDYPTIQVMTFYPGAGPDVMTSSITAPLERQFGQMPGLNQMTSTSSGGSSVVTLQFSLDIDLDVAEQEVQAAMNAAATFLPRDLPAPPVYSKVNPADAPILTLALTSATLPLPQVRDFAETRFAQKISQLSGVGLVSISGGQRPAVRIQANPRALAAYGLTLEDLRTVVAAANVNQAKGGFDGPRRASIINATDQLFAGKDYKALIVAYRNGAPVRLSEVAEVIDDVENTKQAAWMNETPAVIVNIQRQPGTNVIEVVDRVKRLLPQLQGTLPSSVQVSVLTDRTTSIRATVRDVQFELVLAVALVILVIFLFLRTLPATVIPAVAVPLSLIGTFGVMYLMGFSLNNLTLMALTISTGFVVDDAIVMIENIARYIERGASPFQAALKGSKQIAFTILSLTVSLIAVLIPLLFMGDVVGRLFREFAVTLSITILISAVVSLTLTPMMCARLLRERREEQPGPLSRASQRMLDRIIAGYGRSLQWVLQRQQATLVVTAATLVVTVALFVLIPKGAFYRSPVVLRAAAGLAILIMLTVVSKWLLNDEPIEPLVFKSKAKTEQTTLPDGSKVFMNKHSEIAYSINDKGERKVSLKGEAFFEVKHDEKKPFVIQVNEVMIKDIGTAFNVKAVPENNTVEVVVESGEVQFYTPANAGLSLVKGEKAIYEKNTGRFTKVLPTPTENTVSYKSKQFEFKATLLKEVVDQLNAVYPIKIVLQDKSLESMRLSVSFNNEAPEDIIEIIADTFYLETEKTDSTVILKPKKQLN